MVALVNLNSDLKRDFTCQLKTFNVKLVGIRYFEDTSEMQGLTVELPSMRRFDVWFTDPDFPDCLSEVEKSHFEKFLVKGRRYRISAYACGVSGKGDLAISSIQGL